MMFDLSLQAWTYEITTERTKDINQKQEASF